MTRARNRKDDRRSRHDGRNRTGVAVAPDRTKAMLHEVRAGRVQDPGEAARMRVETQRAAPPVGTMPPMVAPEKLTSDVLLDKLGERLAFERTSARLYESLALKLDAHGGFEGGPRREDLERIRDEELEHLGMLSQAIGSHGGDPTAVTPAADLAAVESAGLLQVLSDPRTTLGDGLHAMLTAELVDHEAWAQLIDLADALGEDELVERFERARVQEQDHLERMREWIARDMHVRISA